MNRLTHFTKTLLFYTITIIALANFNSYGQENSITSGSFYVNFKTVAPVEFNWIYPAATDTLFEGNEMLIKVGVHSESEIVKMTLLVNNEEVALNLDQSEILANNPYIEQVVDLKEGVNKLELIARNASGQISKAERTIVMTPPTSIFPVEVTWLYPALSDSIIDQKDILVRIGMKSKSDINKMSLLVNGLPVSTDVRGNNFVFKSHPDYELYVEATITLREGGNVLKFVAQNINGQSDAQERVIKMINKIDMAISTRKNYALLFATDQYDEWNDLTNPISDARTIAKEIKDNYGFNVDLVENFNRDQVMIKIRDYAKKEYGEYDQLFLFFAGHGQFDDLLGQGYVVSKDSKVFDEAKGSYISHSVLRNAIDNIPVQHILLVMDVCYGGTFDPAIARSGSRGQGDLYTEIGLNEYISRKLRFKTRKYITSGGKQYVPDGRPGMHSPFASKFLEGLRSYGGRDNIITLPELTGWLERINPEPRLGSFGTNEPGSDFVFVVKD